MVAQKDEIRLVSKGKNKVPVKNRVASNFLKEFVRRFDEIKLAFPQSRFDGTMDFVCRLDTGDYAMVEMQVMPRDYWDRRALAYVAAFYGNQLRKGESWQDIRKVIGLNILGGGKDGLVHWGDTPEQYMRHYKVQEQLHGGKRYMDGMEIIQYSLMNAPDLPATEQEKKDWLTFFKEGHLMDEATVKRVIKTPAVLQAFECAKLSKLPPPVKAAYDAQENRFSEYSQHTQKVVDKAVKEAVKEAIAIAAKDAREAREAKEIAAKDAREAREAIAIAAKDAREKFSKAVRALKSMGKSSQEIGELLGVSEAEVSEMGD
jgi:hypothetical protein